MNGTKKWAALSAVLASAALLTACSPSDGEPPTTSSTSTATHVQRFVVNGIRLSATVPTGLGEFKPAGSPEGACDPSQDGVGSTTLSGEDDKGPVLLFGSTDAGCPKQRALNGQFPSWDDADQLPADAARVKVGIRGASAEQFDVKYTQCTNSCYDAGYRVTFVTLRDGRTFWMTTGHVDPSTRSAVLESVTVR